MLASWRWWVVLLLTMGCGVAQAQPTREAYHSMEGDRLDLYAWPGKHVVFLTPSADLDRAVMARLLEAADRGWEACLALTGRAPWHSERYSRAGRATIAVVPRTCGEGCGLFGQTGIEIKPNQWDGLYAGMRDQGVISDLIFYEFGRNFWFVGDQTTGIEHVSTGFAVWMRFFALEASGAVGGPFRGRPGSEFRAEVENLIDRFLADPRHTLASTLLANRAPENPMGLGATDLFASFIFRLQYLGGPDFAPRFWRELKARPRSLDLQESLDNIFLAACSAARFNLVNVFQSWRWPLSKGAILEAHQKLNLKRLGGDGLRAGYFGPDLQGLQKERVDTSVNFDWEHDPPFEGGPSQNYSVRWSGFVQAREAGAHTFWVEVDDGVRVWIDNKKVVDQWQEHIGEHAAQVTLAASQKVPIRIEYRQAGGGARIKLAWAGPNLHRQIVSQDNLFSQ